jgi:hypothetical protein
MGAMELVVKPGQIGNRVLFSQDSAGKWRSSSTKLLQVNKVNLW